MLFQEKYPIYTLEIAKTETTCESVDAILAFLKARIEEHPFATFIGIFDHAAHTRSLKDGVMAEGIQEAKNIICCFGKELPSPLVLAVRPRSIGVAELKDTFVVSFLEAPNPVATEAMEKWVLGLRDKG